MVSEYSLVPNIQKRRTETSALRNWLNKKQKDDPSKTQAWLASELDLSTSFLSELLSGQAVPSLPLAIRIEELTGIPPRDLAVAL